MGGRRAGLQAELEEAKLKAKNKNKAVDVETKKPAVDTEPKEKVNFSSMSLSELRAAVQELIDDRYDILGLAGIKEKLDGYISKSGAEFYGQPNGYGSNWHADLAYLWGVPEAGAEKYMKRHLGYLDQAIVNAGGDANNLLANTNYYRSGVANLHREIDFVAAVYETCVFPKLVEASQRYEEFKREFKAAMTNALDQEKHAMHSARSKEARKLGNKLSKEAMNCARNDVPDILDVDVFKTL